METSHPIRVEFLSFNTSNDVGLNIFSCNDFSLRYLRQQEIDVDGGLHSLSTHVSLNSRPSEHMIWVSFSFPSTVAPPGGIIFAQPTATKHQ